MKYAFLLILQEGKFFLGSPVDFSAADAKFAPPRQIPALALNCAPFLEQSASHFIQVTADTQPGLYVRMSLTMVP